MKYIYTAVITPDPNTGKYFCRVPDLDGCITTAGSLSEAIDMIHDAASVWLVSAEDHNEGIAASTPQANIAHAPEDILSVLQIDTLQYRAETDTRAVRKSVSLPAWMASLASKYGMNLSQILQDALRPEFEARALSK